MLLRRLGGAARHLLRVFAYGAIGVVLMLIVVFVVYLDSRPDLDAWHKADLDEEFTADSPVSNLQEYLALEDRLFVQLDEEVYDRTGPIGDEVVNRYKRGSMSDPERWPVNWNRTIEMQAPQASGAVLLLHGLSDSPYSLRYLTERLNEQGLHTLALRLPGHGTAPSGLAAVRWQDMAAAVRLAVNHLSRSNPGQPLYLVGYSNGAALAVEYALAAIDEPELPRVDRLVLISPEIGITSTAALAVWQARLGWLLGLEKLAWNDILPEYDPFKYGSFAINAGDLSYRITGQIQRRIAELGDAGKLDAMPPILAFSSVVDATVLAPALVEHLFNRLTDRGHELVLFNINNQAGLHPLLKWQPDEMLNALHQSPHPSYELTLVTNENSRSRAVIERKTIPGTGRVTERGLGLAWPEGIYSLSHIALPIPPDDPLYGGEPAEPSPGVALGDIAMRGERGVLLVSPAAMLRLRWNPFYSYLEERVMGFLGLSEPEEGR